MISTSVYEVYGNPALSSTLQLSWSSTNVLVGLLWLNNTGSQSQTFNFFYSDMFVHSYSSAPVSGSWNQGVVTTCLTCKSNQLFVSESFAASFQPTSYYVGNSDPKVQTSGLLSDKGSFSSTKPSDIYVGATYSVTVPPGFDKSIQLGWGFSYGSNYAQGSPGASEGTEASAAFASSALSLNFNQVVSSRHAQWNRWLSQAPPMPSAPASPHNTMNQYYYAWAAWLSFYYPSGVQFWDAGQVPNTEGAMLPSASKGVILAYDGFYVIDGWSGLLPMIYFNITMAQKSVALYDAMSPWLGIDKGGIGWTTEDGQAPFFAPLTWLSYVATGNNAWLQSVYLDVNESMNWWLANRYNTTYSLWGWGGQQGKGTDEATGDKPSAYGDGNVNNVAFAPDANGWMIMNMRSFIQISSQLGYSSVSSFWKTILDNTLSSVDKYLWSQQYQDYFALEKNGALKNPANGGKYYCIQTTLLSAGLLNSTRVEEGLAETNSHGDLLPSSPDQYVEAQVWALELKLNYPQNAALVPYETTLFGTANWSPFLLWHYSSEILYWFDVSGNSLQDK